MITALIVLSLANVKNETPPTKLPKLQCLNPVRGGTKLEPTNDIGTASCIAVPDVTKPNRKVSK
jgi:hypothetical protein